MFKIKETSLPEDNVEVSLGIDLYGDVALYLDGIRVAFFDQNRLSLTILTGNETQPLKDKNVHFKGLSIEVDLSQ